MITNTAAQKEVVPATASTVGHDDTVLIVTT